jgi:hypothetical protein
MQDTFRNARDQHPILEFLLLSTYKLYHLSRFARSLSPPHTYPNVKSDEGQREHDFRFSSTTRKQASVDGCMRQAHGTGNYVFHKNLTESALKNLRCCQIRYRNVLVLDSDSREAARKWPFSTAFPRSQARYERDLQITFGSKLGGPAIRFARLKYSSSLSIIIHRVIVISHGAIDNWATRELVLQMADSWT